MALFYDIVPLSVPVEDESDFVGKVKTHKASVDDVAQAVLDAGNEYTKETLVAVFSHMEEAIRDLLSQGYTVVTDNVAFLPVIKGTFERKGTWDADVNSVSCTLTASKTLKEKLAQLKPSFTGNVNTTGGSRISSVLDVLTGSVDGTITAGGPRVVTGVKIKCTDATGESMGAVDFIDTATGESAAQVSVLAANYPKKLIFTCPALDAGSYILRITTHYSTGVPLKTARAICSDPLTVSS